MQARHSTHWPLVSYLITPLGAARLRMLASGAGVVAARGLSCGALSSALSGPFSLLHDVRWLYFWCGAGDQLNKV